MLHQGRSKVRKGFTSWLRDIGVIRKNGSMNAAQAKRELSDYYFMLEQVPKVYDEVTGGLLSKPNYYAHSVIEAHNNYLEKLDFDKVVTFAEDIMELAPKLRGVDFKDEVIKMAKEYIKEGKRE